MQLRAWAFGLLGFVFAVTGILYYEIRKTELPTLPASYSYNILTDPPEAFTAPLEDFAKLYPALLEMERARAGGLALASACFFFAWRNSIAYTHKRYHDEIMEALTLNQLAPTAQPRSRFDDPIPAANTWQRTQGQPEPQGQVWSDRKQL